MVTVQVSLIPVGGLEADRVQMPGHTVFFGSAKSDLANNILRIGEKSFKLDSLQFNPSDVPPPVPPRV